MSSLGELQRWVERGDLTVTYIDAPPRSGSSALFRALVEATGLGAYEPFHHDVGGFEAGLSTLCELVGPQTKPVRIVVKEIARYLSGRDWEDWMGLVDRCIFVVRDPLLQLSSLIKRSANDAHGGYGSDALSDSAVWQRADTVATTLACGGVIDGRTIPANFARLSWRELKDHGASIERRVATGHARPSIVVETSMFRVRPHEQLSELLALLGIQASDASLARMVSRWSGTSRVSRADVAGDDAYRMRVNRATGIEPPLEQAPSLAVFPRALQDYLRSEALPIYLWFVARAGLPSSFALQTLLQQSVDGVRLLDRNLTSVYAALSAMPPSRTRCAAGPILAELRQRYDAEVFGLIDAIAAAGV
jgi:hypothetical protein